MKWIFTTVFALLIVLTYSFGYKKPQKQDIPSPQSQTKGIAVQETRNMVVEPVSAAEHVNISTEAPELEKADPAAFVEFAKKFVGVPYVYGSVNPAVGFDCSGFINHVARHFDLKVPRSSVDFTNFGITVDLPNAKAGDLVLFTGTDASRRIVGHMGIVTENNNGDLQFIHSTSGKAKGVTISEMSDHYKERFVKVVRIMGEA